MYIPGIYQYTLLQYYLNKIKWWRFFCYIAKILNVLNIVFRRIFIDGHCLCTLLNRNDGFRSDDGRDPTRKAHSGNGSVVKEYDFDLNEKNFATITMTAMITIMKLQLIQSIDLQSKPQIACLDS